MTMIEVDDYAGDEKYFITDKQFENFELNDVGKPIPTIGHGFALSQLRYMAVEGVDHSNRNYTCLEMINDEGDLLSISNFSFCFHA